MPNPLDNNPAYIRDRERLLNTLSIALNDPAAIKSFLGAGSKIMEQQGQAAEKARIEREERAARGEEEPETKSRPGFFVRVFDLGKKSWQNRGALGQGLKMGLWESYGSTQWGGRTREAIQTLNSIVPQELSKLKIAQQGGYKLEYMYDEHAPYASEPITDASYVFGTIYISEDGWEYRARDLMGNLKKGIFSHPLSAEHRQSFQQRKSDPIFVQSILSQIKEADESFSYYDNTPDSQNQYLLFFELLKDPRVVEFISDHHAPILRFFAEQRTKLDPLIVANLKAMLPPGTMISAMIETLLAQTKSSYVPKEPIDNSLLMNTLWDITQPLVLALILNPNTLKDVGVIVEQVYFFLAQSVPQAPAHLDDMEEPEISPLLKALVNMPLVNIIQNMSNTKGLSNTFRQVLHNNLLEQHLGEIITKLYPFLRPQLETLGIKGVDEQFLIKSAPIILQFVRFLAENLNLMQPIVRYQLTQPRERNDAEYINSIAQLWERFEANDALKQKVVDYVKENRKQLHIIGQSIIAPVTPDMAVPPPEEYLKAMHLSSDMALDFVLGYVTNTPGVPAAVQTDLVLFKITDALLKAFQANPIKFKYFAREFGYLSTLIDTPLTYKRNSVRVYRALVNYLLNNAAFTQNINSLFMLDEHENSEANFIRAQEIVVFLLDYFALAPVLEKWGMDLEALLPIFTSLFSQTITAFLQDPQTTNSVVAAFIKPLLSPDPDVKLIYEWYAIISSESSQAVELMIEKIIPIVIFGMEFLIQNSWPLENISKDVIEMTLNPEVSGLSLDISMEEMAPLIPAIQPLVRRILKEFAKQENRAILTKCIRLGMSILMESDAVRKQQAQMDISKLVFDFIANNEVIKKGIAKFLSKTDNINIIKGFIENFLSKANNIENIKAMLEPSRQVPEWISILNDFVVNVGFNESQAALDLGLYVSVKLLGKPDLYTQYNAFMMPKEPLQAADAVQPEMVPAASQVQVEQEQEAAPLGPQILSELSRESVQEIMDALFSVEPGFNKELKNNASFFSELSYFAMMSVLGTKAEQVFSKELLVELLLRIDFNNSKFFGLLKELVLNPQAVKKAQGMLSTVLNTPVVTQKLANLKIEKQWIIDLVPLIGQAFGALLQEPNSIKAIIDFYLINDPFELPEEKNRKLLNHLIVLLDTLTQMPESRPEGELDLEAEQNQLKHSDFARALQSYLIKNKAAIQAFLPKDAFIQSMLDIMVSDASQLLTLAMPLMRAALNRSESVDMLMVLTEVFSQKPVPAVAKKALEEAPSENAPLEVAQELAPASEITPPSISKTKFVPGMRAMGLPWLRLVLKDLSSNRAFLGDLIHNLSNIILESNEALKIKKQTDLFKMFSEYMLTVNTEQLSSVTGLGRLLVSSDFITAIPKISSAVLKTPLMHSQATQLSALGIDQQLLTDFTPMAAKITSVFLEQAKAVQSIVGGWIDMQPESEFEPDETEFFDALCTLRDAFQTQQNVFHQEIQQYYLNNQSLIQAALESNIGVIRAALNPILENLPVTVSDDLIIRMIQLGITTLNDCLPAVFEGFSDLFRPENKETVMSLIKDIVEYIDLRQEALEVDEGAQTQKQEKIEAAFNKIVNSLYNIPELRKIIDSKVPQILTAKSPLLGEILDELINQSKFGKYIDIPAQRYVQVLSRHMPELIAIAELNTEKRRARMMVKILGVVFSLDILKLMATLSLQYTSYVYQSKVQVAFSRRWRAQAPMNEVLEQVLRKRKKSSLFNLADALDHVTDKNQPFVVKQKIKENATLRYSIDYRDLSGLHFMFQANHNTVNEAQKAQGAKLAKKKHINFSRCELNGFNFDNATFDCSFEGSVISNCSFKNVEFGPRVSFKNVTMDTFSHASLQLAVHKHNQKHPDQAISLASVKLFNSAAKPKK